MTSSRSARLLAGLALPLALAGAGCGQLVGTFDVTRTTEGLFTINPSGLFPKPAEEIPPPVTELYAVELRAPATWLVIAEELWIADGTDGERTATKKVEATDAATGCTTTRTRSITFDLGNGIFAGGFTEETRTEGPEGCGATPKGERAVGTLVGAPPGAAP